MLVTPQEIIEKYIWVFNLIMAVTFRGDAHYMTSCEAGKATGGTGIGSMQLGPRLLQKTDPNLIVSTSGKGWLSKLICW